MGAPTSLTEIENINKLVVQYKTLQYQEREVFPKLTGLSGFTKVGGSPTSIYFDQSVARAITEAGQKRLAELVKELEEYGIIQLI